MRHETSNSREINQRMPVVLTGKEISTRSGGLSRHPSAAAYATAKTYVLSHNTSRAGRDKADVSHKCNMKKANAISDQANFFILTV